MLHHTNTAITGLLVCIYIYIYMCVCVYVYNVSTYDKNNNLDKRSMLREYVLAYTYTYKVLSHFLTSVLSVITYNKWNFHALFNVYLKNKHLLYDAESLDV